MYKKCTIQISFHHPALCLEVFPSDAESTEVAVEGVISTALMELFGGEILVDTVIVQDSQSNYMHDDELIYLPEAS